MENNNSQNVKSGNGILDTILFYTFVICVGLCIFIGYSVKISGDKNNILNKKAAPYQPGYQEQIQPGK